MSIPPIHTINLTPSQMLFYQLNVIHDIIHDYGFYAAETRWSKNAKNVKQFLADRFTLVADTSSDDIDINAEDDVDGDDNELEGGRGRFSQKLARERQGFLLNLAMKGKTQENQKQRKEKQEIQRKEKQEQHLQEQSQKQQKQFQKRREPDVARGVEVNNEGPVDEDHDVDNDVDYRTINLESSTPQARVAVLTDIYNSHVKKINSNFVEQIKNSIIFNFFGVLFQPSPNGSPTILLNTGPHQYDIYQLAYLVVVSINPQDYTWDNNNNQETMTADEKSLDEFRRDPRWMRNAPTPLSESVHIPELADLYHCIALKFGDYLSSKWASPRLIQMTWNFEKIKQLYNDLSDFLDSSIICHSRRYIDNQIQMNKKIHYTYVNIVDSCISEVLGGPSVCQSGGQSGGAPTQDDYDYAFAKNKIFTDAIFHTPISDYGGISYFQKLEELMRSGGYNPDETPREAKRVYDSLKTTLENLVGAGATVNLKEIAEPFPRRIPNNKDQAVDRLKSKINDWLSKYLKQEKKTIIEWNKLQAEEAARLVRQAASAARADLDPESSTVRSGFLKAVASLGLFLNGITKNNIPAQQVIPGQIVGMLTSIPQNELLRNLLIAELSILFHYTGIGSVSIGPQGNSSLIDPRGKRDLDTVLINVVDDYLKLNQAWSGGRYYCNSRQPNNKLYIIDNAAKIPTKDRDNNVFCPLSSIIDGMNQCTLGASGSYSATNIVEYGNMNFEITDETRNANAHYKGQLQLCDNFSIGNNVHNTVTYTLQYKGYNNSAPEITTSIQNIEVKNGKIRNLEAHNILKNTLVNILEIYIRLLQNEANTSEGLLGNYLTTSGQSNLFENLTKVIVTGKFKPTPESVEELEIGTIRKNELLKAFFTILGKGAGDIFQELNAVCKHGGYTSGRTSLPSIIPWGRDGNTRRFFAANDRPSATRFIFLLKYGRSDQINEQSFGGYISNKEIIAQRVPGQVVCSFMPASIGGSIKRKYKSKKKIE